MCMNAHTWFNAVRKPFDWLALIELGLFICRKTTKMLVSNDGVEGSGKWGSCTIQAALSVLIEKTLTISAMAVAVGLRIEFNTLQQRAL